MALVAYTFLLSNLGHCQRGKGRGKNELCMRYEYNLKRIVWKKSENQA